MKDYETNDAFPGYFKDDAQNYGDIKQHGIVPHLTVELIVVDEIRREVVLVCDTERDINLSEHGIAICFHEGQWRFKYEGYLSEYKAAVQEGENERLWSMARLPGMPAGESETDISFIFGTWEFDAHESRALLERAKCSRKAIDETLKAKGRINYQISQTICQQITGPQPTQKWEYVFVECERHGERVIIRLKEHHRDDIFSEEFYYQNGLLMNLDGLVLRKKV